MLNSRRFILLYTAVAISAFGQISSTPTGPVISLGNLAHATADLDKTVAFYRDVLGLDLSGAIQPPAALDELNSKFTNTQGAKFRAATFKVPNASYGMELTEFTGIERKPVQPRIYDTGAVSWNLTIRDMDAMMAKLKQAGTPIVTAGGAPIKMMTDVPSNKTRSIVVKDPDGFFLELIQTDPLPANAAAAKGDVLGGAIAIAVEDTTKTLAFYKEVFGFQARPAGAFGNAKTVMDLINAQGAEWRITHGTIPVFGCAAPCSANADFGLIEFKSIDRKSVQSRAQDPGSPMFTITVKDVDATVAKWKANGGSVMSTGGQPAVRPNGSKNVFVHDPNGFLFELIQRAAQ